MINLSDAELQIVIRAALPLQPRDRDQFLRDVADELQRYEVIGVGVIHRVTATVQKKHLNPPTMQGSFRKHGR